MLTIASSTPPCRETALYASVRRTADRQSRVDVGVDCLDEHALHAVAGVADEAAHGALGHDEDDLGVLAHGQVTPRA